MRSRLMASRISVPGLIAVVAVVVLAARASGQNAATFDIPFDKLPGGRMNAQGNLDQTSSPADAHAGAFVAAKKLGLFRNFEWLHWVPTAPSKRDPATGRWSGGDLDGFPTGWGSTGLGIAGDCLYWGRSNSTNTTGPRVTHDVRIYKILHPDLRHERARRLGATPRSDVEVTASSKRGSRRIRRSSRKWSRRANPAVGQLRTVSHRGRGRLG